MKICVNMDASTQDIMHEMEKLNFENVCHVDGNIFEVSSVGWCDKRFALAPGESTPYGAAMNQLLSDNDITLQQLATHLILSEAHCQAALQGNLLLSYPQIHLAANLFKVSASSLEKGEIEPAINEEIILQRIEAVKLHNQENKETIRQLSDVLDQTIASILQEEQFPIEEPVDVTPEENLDMVATQEGAELHENNFAPQEKSLLRL